VKIISEKPESSIMIRHFISSSYFLFVMLLYGCVIVLSKYYDDANDYLNAESIPIKIKHALLGIFMMRVIAANYYYKFAPTNEQQAYEDYPFRTFLTQHSIISPIYLFMFFYMWAMLLKGHLLLGGLYWISGLCVLFLIRMHRRQKNIRLNDMSVL